MRFHHFPHFLIPGHHNITHLTAVFGDRGTCIMQRFCRIEKAVPGIHVLLFPWPLILAQNLIKTAGMNAV